MGNLFVKKLQNKLNERGYNLKVDGIWGPKTKATFMDANNRNANEAAGAYVNLINNVEEAMKPGPDFVPDDQGVLSMKRVMLFEIWEEPFLEALEKHATIS